jgi:tRNA-2-methylthio-N6-dimethylallyladenosine synthase
MPEKTFHIMTFGCQMNVHDSDWLRRSLLAAGFTEQPFEAARVQILNTCSVRAKPEHKVYTELGRIRLLARKFPERDIIACVGGCVAQQLGGKLFAKSRELKLLFGTDGLAHAPAAIALLAENSAQTISLLDFSSEYAERTAPGNPAGGAEFRQGIAPVPENAARPAQTTPAPPAAYVNIMQGCDNFCTYCIVPFVRGRQKSRTVQAVLEECRALVKGGCKEITLLGQNVNAFGQDPAVPGKTGIHAPGAGSGDTTNAFVSLLHQLAGISGLQRLRFITPHPKDMPDGLIEAFAQLPVLAPRLHLPLQSGSDRVLKRMNRQYDLRHYMRLVSRLKSARPGIQLSTDIIVGFPGETEEDFSATMRAMREADFAASFSFVYSDRPGTKAGEYTDKVPREEALERLSRLQRWQDDNTRRILRSLVGAKAQVLIEEASLKKGHSNMRGRDAYGFSVHIPLRPGELINIGDMAQVRISEAGRHTLRGRLD